MSSPARLPPSPSSRLYDRALAEETARLNGSPTKHPISRRTLRLPSYMSCPNHLLPDEDDPSEDPDGERLAYYRNPFPLFDPDPTGISNPLTEEVRHHLNASVAKILSLIRSQYPPDRMHADHSISGGPAGIAYMFWKLSRKVPLGSFDQKLLCKNAYEYVISALRTARKNIDSHPRRTVCSFLFGEVGVYALASAICIDLGLAEDADNYARVVFDYHVHATDEKYPFQEFSYGLAGYLFACLFVNKYGCSAKGVRDSVVPHSLMEAACLKLITRGKHQALSCPLMWKWDGADMQFGASHGIAGVVHVLMMFPDLLSSNKEARMQVKKVVDYLIEHRFASHNFPVTLGQDDEQDQLVGWAHGATGALYMLIDAYRTFGDAEYLKAAEEAAEVVWYRGLSRSGVGLASGISGNGYAFLAMFEATQNPMYLHQAVCFAEFCLRESKREDLWMPAPQPRMPEPGNPYGLFDGLAGLACFLSDILVPQVHCFPAFELLEI